MSSWRLCGLTPEAGRTTRSVEDGIPTRSVGTRENDLTWIRIYETSVENFHKSLALVPT
jgi:hypothetical protein